MLQTISNLAVDGLLAFVIVRGAREKLLFSYPVFYIYLAHVLILDLFRFCIYTFSPRSYAEVYWYTQFLSLIIGYCVIWELYSKALQNYQGVAQMSQAIVSIALIVLLTGFLNNALVGPIWGAAKTVMELERNMRAVQAMLLIALMGLVYYYAIPLGRNLRGVFCGYGFFVWVSIVRLTVRSYLGDPIRLIWNYLPPITYLVSLIIWCVALRSYQPIPEPETEVTMEQDYQAIVAGTWRSIARARHLIVRTIRP